MDKPTDSFALIRGLAVGFVIAYAVMLPIGSAPMV